MRWHKKSFWWSYSDLGYRIAHHSMGEREEFICYPPISAEQDKVIGRATTLYGAVRICEQHNEDQNNGQKRLG